MPQLLDPNWPIYASQRAVRYYWPCKKRHLAELTSRFDTSRKHDWTNENVQFIMDFFVVERFKKKKDVRFLWRFYLSFFLFFFSRMDYEFLSSHPFPDARSPLWNSSRFSELIYLPAGFRLLYVSRLYANRDSIVMYQLIEIPVHIIRTWAAVNSDR